MPVSRVLLSINFHFLWIRIKEYRRYCIKFIFTHMGHDKIVSSFRFYLCLFMCLYVMVNTLGYVSSDPSSYLPRTCSLRKGPGQSSSSTRTMKPHACFSIAGACFTFHMYMPHICGCTWRAEDIRFLRVGVCRQVRVTGQGIWESNSYLS